ncbi:MAG: translation initiation factor 2 [Lachnospiraceae bacterium]|nr:translation initiation factor 2 [Lachnospiraceae bacterium]
MTGSYHIVVVNATSKYELDIKRNITILKGDSATGKTVLVDMIRDYVSNGSDSGITLSCDIPCRVIDGNTWEEQLSPINNSIVFIDEGNRFVSSEEFAHYVREGKNYYVIVTREKLSNLPYSVTEIYGIRSSGKYNDMVPVYHETYHIYEEYIRNLQAGECITPDVILTEDSNAGYDFFNTVAHNNSGNIECRAAGGKSNLYGSVIHAHDHSVLIIADGAAFGAEMERICELIHSGADLHLFLPESFEWLILNSGVIKDISKDEMEHAENYADSEKFFSWERYFTHLLTQNTIGTPMAYSKTRLNDYYRSSNITKRILATVQGIDFHYESRV